MTVRRADTVPALSTMTQPFSDIGTTAVAGLVERIDEPSIAARTTVLPVAMVARRSCGCPEPSGAVTGDPANGLPFDVSVATAS